MAWNDVTIMDIKRKTGIFSSDTCRFEYLINIYHIWSGKVTSEWKNIKELCDWPNSTSHLFQTRVIPKRQHPF